MFITQLDAAIRAGAVVTLLLLAWQLFASRRKIGLPAKLFVPLSLCIAGFVIGNTPLRDTVPGGIVGSVLHGLSGFTVIFLWWFCLSCFDRHFRVQGSVLLVALLWAVVAVLDRGLVTDRFVDMGLSTLLVPIGFVIVAHLVWRLLAEHHGDLIERRREARVMAAILLGGMLFIDLAADALFGDAWRPLAFSMTQNAMVLLFGLWLARRLLSIRSELLIFGSDNGPIRTAGAALPSTPGFGDALHQRLDRLMRIERIFLEPDLTFSRFVERMGASERAVRSLIHQELGHDHFRTFLNHYRVEEARRLLVAKGSGEKLIAIALDCGFASLASFNRVFRAIEGRTPSDYRAAAGQAGASQNMAEQTSL